MTTQAGSGSTKARATLAELQEERDALILAFPLALVHAAKNSPISAPPAATPAKVEAKSAAPNDSAIGLEESASDLESATTASKAPPADALPSPDYAAQVLAEAKRIVKEHISLLHEYNEIRDIGYGLLGMIADQRGVRLVDAMEEFGVTSGD